MFAFSKWRASMISWAENKRWALFYCYLNLFREKYGFERMTWMKEVLVMLQEVQPNEMFGTNPFWQELRGALGESTKWYKNYVESLLTNEEHINRLIVKGWFWHFELLWANAKDVAPSTLAEALALILRTPEFRKPFNKFVHFDVLLDNIVKGEPSTSQKLLRFYTSYFDALPKSTLVILEWVDFESSSRDPFIDTCLEKGFNELLHAFYGKLDINRTENKVWLNMCFRSLVFATLPLYTLAYNRIKKRLDSIIRHYKLNVNNIYMDFTDVMRREFATRDPLRNHELWAGKNLPVVAFAVMYNRTDIVQWLLTLGAKLNRCAISMEDLTTNPKMLALFRANTQATKIQSAYLKHMMHPDHPTQANRQAGWDALAKAKPQSNKSNKSSMTAT